jgi:hypothetical protein
MISQVNYAASALKMDLFNQALYLFHTFTLKYAAATHYDYILPLTPTFPTSPKKTPTPAPNPRLTPTWLELGWSERGLLQESVKGEL